MRTHKAMCREKSQHDTKEVDNKRKLESPYQLREGDRVSVHFSEEDKWSKGKIVTVFDEIDDSLTVNIAYEDEEDKKVVTHRNFENFKFELLKRSDSSICTTSCHQRRPTDCSMCCCIEGDLDAFQEIRETVLRDYESLGRLIGLALLRKINFGIRFSNTFCDLLLRGGYRDDTISDEELVRYVVFERISNVFNQSLIKRAIHPLDYSSHDLRLETRIQVRRDVFPKKSEMDS